MNCTQRFYSIGHQMMRSALMIRMTRKTDTSELQNYTTVKYITLIGSYIYKIHSYSDNNVPTTQPRYESSLYYYLCTCAASENYQQSLAAQVHK